MAYPDHIIRRALELKRGRSAGAVLRQLEREFPGQVASLNVRTILRWERTKSVPLADTQAPAGKEEGYIPGDFQAMWEEHNAKLAAVANALLANGLKRIVKGESLAGDVEYLLFDESQTHVLERLTDDDLSGCLEANLHTVYRDYTDWFYQNCFCPHLFAEWSEDVQTRMSGALLYDHPYELIEALRLLAERKTFKGTCPVCRDW
jgi:hypothetical protein